MKEVTHFDKTIGVLFATCFSILCWIAIISGLLALLGCKGVQTGDSKTEVTTNSNNISYLDLEQKEKCEKCGIPNGLIELGYEWLVCSDICPADEIDGIDKECDLRCIAEREQIQDDCYLNYDCPQIKQ